jgi:hypothetical protein
MRRSRLAISGPLIDPVLQTSTVLKISHRNLTSFSAKEVRSFWPSHQHLFNGAVNLEEMEFEERYSGD